MKMAGKGSHNILNIRGIINDAKCFHTVRELRWSDRVGCAHCGSDTVVKHGRDETRSERQRYHCRNCNRYFDDLTGTIFEGRHEPLSIWILCLYFMGLNLSNSRIAYELDPDTSNVQQMTEQLRQGVVARKPERKLSEQVECDELYVVAGHKGESKLARKKGVKVEVTV
uniref:Transposase n=1 Tax=Candidatus Kentrum eta TaxID=2126337 RepID=A0A450VP59_9GAMM|nr:MAG: Transposase [Candidatus Kentron sp. H]